MQIKYRGDRKFEIKTKDLEISFGDHLVINGFTFPGPGEYEKGGAIINGIADQGNTIFVVNIEEMNLCHLGALNHDLSEDEAKQIGDVDILFLPLGFEPASLKIALKNLAKIDPRVIIPMEYADLAEFKKSEGITDGELDILKIKKVDLPDEERKIFILNPS